MARPSSVLVDALRATAVRLEAGSRYQWGHHGECNCGHLVQTLCRLPPARIHQLALDGDGDGDWEQIANAYCPTSGRLIDDIVSELLSLGLTVADLGHLENLDDPRVLASLPGGHLWLRRNQRADVVAYLHAWATLLALELPAVDLPDVARAA